MRARCAVVPRGEGESARKKLSDDGLLRTDLAIKSDSANVLLPVLEGPETGYPERDEEFEPVAIRIRSYKEIAEVPNELAEQLPTSFDIIGDVAVFKLDDALVPYAEKIGDAMLEANKGIASAALDEGVEGEMRVRCLRVVAGRKSTATVHKEYGISLQVDPARVYFSPRLANERWRVARLVGDGEAVVDMFAGVGPFSILIAKTRSPGAVHAIDVNAYAVEMLRENIRLNKAERVEAHLGNARQIAPKLGKADRIIMNLPHSAHEFLDTAAKIAKPGATIHLYQIVGKGREEGRARELEEMAPGASCQLSRIVHPYSPGSSVVVYDLVKG